MAGRKRKKASPGDISLRYSFFFAGQFHLRLWNDCLEETVFDLIVILRFCLLCDFPPSFKYLSDHMHLKSLLENVMLITIVSSTCYRWYMIFSGSCIANKIYQLDYDAQVFDHLFQHLISVDLLCNWLWYALISLKQKQMFDSWIDGYQRSFDFTDR